MGSFTRAVEISGNLRHDREQPSHGNGESQAIATSLRYAVRQLGHTQYGCLSVPATSRRTRHRGQFSVSNEASSSIASVCAP